MYMHPSPNSPPTLYYMSNAESSLLPRLCNEVNRAHIMHNNMLD